MAGLRSEDCFSLRRILDVALGQINVAPWDSSKLTFGRVPWVVRIRKAHPTKPVFIIAALAKPINCPIGHPVSVIDLAIDRIIFHLNDSGVTATHRIDFEVAIKHWIEHAECFWMIVQNPDAVVQGSIRAMRCTLEVVKAPVRARCPVVPRIYRGMCSAGGHTSLWERIERIDVGLEVRLADERRGVSRSREFFDDTRRINRQRNTIHPDSVRGRVLPRNDGGARRHTDH